MSGEGSVKAAGETEVQGANPIGRESVSVLRIEPSHGWVSLKLHEVWEYRELLYFLTWRDIKSGIKRRCWD